MPQNIKVNTSIYRMETDQSNQTRKKSFPIWVQAAWKLIKNKMKKKSNYKPEVVFFYLDLEEVEF